MSLRLDEFLQIYLYKFIDDFNNSLDQRLNNSFLLKSFFNNFHYYAEIINSTSVCIKTKVNFRNTDFEFYHTRNIFVGEKLMSILSRG